MNTASALRLTFACGLYDRMVPLYTGDVQPEGIDLNFLAIDDPLATVIVVEICMTTSMSCSTR